MSQSAEDFLALLRHIINKHGLDTRAQDRALEVVKDRLSSGGPYRSTPMEDYLLSLERELKEKTKLADQMMDRVVHLEKVHVAVKPENEIMLLNGWVAALLFLGGALTSYLLGLAC